MELHPIASCEAIVGLESAVKPVDKTEFQSILVAQLSSSSKNMLNKQELCVG